ncbi:uncharacterized protein DUF3352 [Anseongella ginsenosidimutans]|uniref:Uncharacterized protein DUF3352 n=1 Tax=Anseongella ginsenosidimutans TaxID=496056 RepID=A0A4R3KUA9_9SPHI|nr:DUF3352 domain-containing protein [Anseongella ginsenosidimutans]QEC51642.1 DUF3352 domain-containing protein [Anseongella ginsenosidimutans]TCS88977.1 uncharacterized protein DUF3352 [Anseongella ginsenosidimutans]
MRKKILISLSVCLGVLLLLVLGRLFLLPDKYLRQVYLVPRDAIFILETDEPVESWKTFSNSEMWQFMKGYPPFAEIAASAGSLDTVLQENRRLFDLIGSRNLMISAHITRPGDYDFLFLADLQNISKTGSLKNQLDKLYGALDYRVTTRRYENTEIKELYDPAQRETLYLAFVRNHLVCSYTGLLVEAAIREVREPQLGRDLNFIDIMQQVPGRGLCKLYLNYRYVDNYLELYMGGENQAVNDICSSLFYSGLNIGFDKNDLVLEGVSNYADTLDAYLVTLMRSGAHKMDAPGVLSQRTAFYLGLGFNDVDDFYANLELTLKQDEASWQSFREGVSMIERRLKINVKENLLSWMDGEIVFAQNEPGRLGRQQEFVVAIKAKDIDDAREHLDLVKEQVRKNTPLKFETINYQGYAINYLELSGFFRLFFGKMFERLEKPYYTIVDDYVLFSNSTETLLNLVEDHRQELTLSADKDFREFEKNFGNRSTVFAYFNSLKAFPLLKTFASGETWSSLQTHRKYVEAIRHVGLQLTAEDAPLFETRLRLDFENEPLSEEEIPYQAGSDTLDNLERFYVEKLQKNVYREFYENGSLRSEVETSKGLKDGRYKEYYPGGELKIFGRYKNNLRTGRWRYYDDEGKFIRKERYSEGVRME